MITIPEFVRVTSYEITSPQYQLPEWVWSAISALNKVHRVWRWHRKAALYSNPENFAALFGGHVINIIFGQSTLLKIAAQTLMIATRLLECSKRQASLYREGKKLLSAIKGHYPAPIHLPWLKNQSNTYLSPSSAYSWKLHYIETGNRLNRIVRIMINICRKTLTLSMCLLDTIDAFYLSPASQNEAVQESCVNLIRCLNILVENKESLLEGLSDNRELIEKILKSTPITYSQLHTAAASFGNGIVSFNEFSKSLKRALRAM